jgi:pSer/pThr/pTyr-binding forkhead associated (FHA) protein
MSELNSTNITYNNNQDIHGMQESKGREKKDKDRKEFIIDRIKIEEHLDKLSSQ